MREGEEEEEEEEERRVGRKTKRWENSTAVVFRVSDAWKARPLKTIQTLRSIKFTIKMTTKFVSYNYGNINRAKLTIKKIKYIKSK